MRCDFCYNPEIVLNKGKYSFDDLLEFFESRKNLLDGIVFCGGEPTLNAEVIDTAKELKKMGYKIKLDTNGLKPNIVKEMIKKDLIDYFALDFKASKNSFEQITKVRKNLFDEFLKTLDLLIKSDLDFEVRTTYHSALFSKNDIDYILATLEKYNYQKTYYIQNFMDSTQTLGEIKEKNNQQKLEINNTKYNFEIKYRNF